MSYQVQGFAASQSIQDGAQLGQPSAPTPQRGLESIASVAMKIREQSNYIASIMYGARQRLLGESDPQQASETKVKEVARCELDSLANIVNDIEQRLNDIERYAKALDRI